MDRPVAVASRIIALCALAFSISGCDGDEDPGAAGFATREGALREISQLGNIVIYDQPVLGARQGGRRFPTHLSVAPFTDCESGTVDAEEGEGMRSFVYFDKTDMFAYERRSFDGCTKTMSAEQSDTQSGFLETGREAEHDPSNLSDSYDQYAEYGAEGEPYAYARIVSGAAAEELHERILGRVEWRGSDVGAEAGTVLERTLERPLPDGYSLSWRQGFAQDPLYLVDNIGVRTSANGPYAYASSRCAGGSRRVQGTVYRDDDGYPRSGELTISTPNESVTATFDDDGNAALSFSNGATATLTALEIRQAFDEPAC